LFILKPSTLTGHTPSHPGSGRHTPQP
jgi:hypothetical protein